MSTRVSAIEQNVLPIFVPSDLDVEIKVLSFLSKFSLCSKCYKKNLGGNVDFPLTEKARMDNFKCSKHLSSIILDKRSLCLAFLTR